MELQEAAVIASELLQALALLALSAYVAVVIVLFAMVGYLVLRHWGTWHSR